MAEPHRGVVLLRLFPGHHPHSGLAGNAPAGARFQLRIVLDILCEEDKPLVARLLEGLRLLEDDALGGGGSRGNGRIRLTGARLVWRGRAYYASGAQETELASSADLAALQPLVMGEDFLSKLSE